MCVCVVIVVVVEFLTPNNVAVIWNVAPYVYTVCMCICACDICVCFTESFTDRDD